MGLETTFWRTEVRPSLINFGLAYRIENAVDVGMPDVTYCFRRYKTDNQAISGWIELKHCDAWPKRESSYLRFKRYSVEQANWLYDWSNFGGKACILCKIDPGDYFLMSGIYAHELRQGMTRKRIMDGTAAVTGTAGVFPAGRIVRWLTEK